jgi:hypothetical protein
MSTTTPTTFADLYTDAINRVRASTSDSSTVEMMKRYINQANHDVHIQQNWPWAERNGQLILHPTYSTGTVSITTGSSRLAVTGSSTAWTSDASNYGFNNARIGGKMLLGSSVNIHRVATVGGATSITLATTTPYLGDDLSGASYTYFEDEYDLPSDFWRLIDARKFSDTMPIDIIGRQEFHRRYARNSTVAAAPRVCTIIPVNASADVGTNDVYRVQFHPVPSAVLAVPFRYITINLARDTNITDVGPNLVSDTDVPIIPLRYRHVLIFYAISHWYRDRKDDQRSAEANGEYTDLVRRMAGDLLPDRDHPRLVHNKRTYLRGAAGYRRNSRYSTGTAFDELRDW